MPRHELWYNTLGGPQIETYAGVNQVPNQTCVQYVDRITPPSFVGGSSSSSVRTHNFLMIFMCVPTALPTPHEIAEDYTHSHCL